MLQFIKLSGEKKCTSWGWSLSPLSNSLFHFQGTTSVFIILLPSLQLFFFFFGDFCWICLFSPTSNVWNATRVQPFLLYSFLSTLTTLIISVSLSFLYNSFGLRLPYWSLQYRPDWTPDSYIQMFTQFILLNM